MFSLENIFHFTFTRNESSPGDILLHLDLLTIITTGFVCSSLSAIHKIKFNLLTKPQLLLVSTKKKHFNSLLLFLELKWERGNCR